MGQYDLEDFTPPQLDFELPLPRIRFNGPHIDVVGLQIVTNSTNKARFVHLRFLDLSSKPVGAYEIFGEVPQFALLTKFISENVSEIGNLYGKSDYALVTECKDGSLLFALTEKGREQMKEENSYDFLLDGITGNPLRIHEEKLHRILNPPFISHAIQNGHGKQNRTLWHYVGKRGQKNNFMEDLDRVGWVKFERING